MIRYKLASSEIKKNKNLCNIYGLFNTDNCTSAKCHFHYVLILLSVVILYCVKQARGSVHTKRTQK